MRKVRDSLSMDYRSRTHLKPVPTYVSSFYLFLVTTGTAASPYLSWVPLGHVGRVPRMPRRAIATFSKSYVKTRTSPTDGKTADTACLVSPRSKATSLRCLCCPLRAHPRLSPSSFRVFQQIPGLFNSGPCHGGAYYREWASRTRPGRPERCGCLSIPYNRCRNGMVTVHS